MTLQIIEAESKIVIEENMEDTIAPLRREAKQDAERVRRLSQSLLK